MTITSPQTYAETIMKTFNYWPSRKVTASFIKDKHIHATVILDEGIPVDEFVQHIIKLCTNLDAPMVIISHVAEADTIDTTQAEWLKLAQAQITKNGDIEVVEALLLSRTRVKSIGCTNPECCPVDGNTVDFTGLTSSEELELEYKVKPFDRIDTESMVNNMFTHFDYAVDSYVVEGYVTSHDLWLIMAHIQENVFRDLLLDYILDPDYSFRATAYTEKDAVDAFTWMALRAPGLMRGKALGMAAALHASTNDLTVAVRVLAEQSENDSFALRMLGAVYQGVPPWEIREKLMDSMRKSKEEYLLRVQYGPKCENVSV